MLNNLPFNTMPDSTSLLKYLQSIGKISEENARKVLTIQSTSHKTEEACIRQLGVVSEDDIVQAKSKIFNIPYIDLTNNKIEDSVVSEIPINLLEKYKAVPFERGERNVKIAMIDPFDIQTIQALQSKYPMGTKLDIFITSEDSLSSVLSRRVDDVMSSQVSTALEDVDDVPATQLNVSEDVTLSSSNLSSAPISRIVNSILEYGVSSNSSDIHIEPLDNRLRVRFRVNGVLIERLSLPKNLTPAVVSRVKIMSNLKIDEKRIPQDGRIPLKIGERRVDLRVSTMPTIHGEKVVLRLLETDTSSLALEKTGLRGNAYKIFLDALNVTNGIILVTGPTGSGKTRTLACSLLKVNDPGVNIISLENPVEIRVPGVNQVQINPDVGLTFASALRAVLRQDPDKVMVGEIRDGETAELAVQASLTGHLVLSTLHTNSAPAAVPRLIDMGIEPYLLASTLRVIAAQRLPRKICPHCIEAYPATVDVLKNITEVMQGAKDFNLINYLNGLAASKQTPGSSVSPAMKAPTIGPNGEPQIYLYRGKGCDKCDGTGYTGRIGIFEVMKVTEKIANLVMENVTADDIKDAAMQDGMYTMTQDGYLKALEGTTTIEEVLRVSRE